MITLKYNDNEVRKVIEALEMIKHQGYHDNYNEYMTEDFNIFINLLNDIKKLEK